jgi:hypothetical protein
MKAIYFDGDNGLIVRKEEIPENLKIDNSFQTVFQTDINLDCSCIQIQSVSYTLNRCPRPCSQPVQFVNKDKSRDVMRFIYLLTVNVCG